MRLSTDFQRKIMNREALLRAVHDARAAGKTIVQCHGCFDIVHPGHIRYLEFARRQGDVLIVSLTGDLDVGKGDSRPYIPQDLRAENLAALVFVDLVYVNDAATAEELLGAVRPDLYVKGREYEVSTDPGFLAEKRVVEAYGGRIVFSSGDVVFSSTDIIESLPTSREAESHRLSLLCRRHQLTGQGIAEIVARFRDKHVLVIGDVVVDRYVFCDPLGIASESPMISLAHRGEHMYVGGAAIVARHIAALGGHAFLLSAGSNDSLARLVTEVLAAEGVETNLLPARAAMVQKTRFLADDAKLFKLDQAERLPLDSQAEKRAAIMLEQQSKLADAVIFCDFGYGMITAGLLQRALPTIRQNVGTIAADVSGGKSNLLNFRNVDLLCPTEREIRAMLDDHTSGLSAVAWQILRETQARHLFVTLDKHGVVVFERRSQDRTSPDWSARLKSEQIPSFGDRVIDRLGCGDALLAASTLALAAGASPVQSAYLGNAAAAIKLAKLGNHPVELDELRDWLRGRRELGVVGPEHSARYAAITAQHPAAPGVIATASPT